MKIRTIGIIILVLFIIVGGLINQFMYRANHPTIYIVAMVPDKENIASQCALTAIEMQIDEVGKINS